MSSGICADCGAPNPTWASINRGVFICDECCSIHRGLGRHISYIRSLHSNNWPPVLKETVYTLVNKGANSIWEHALHDGHSKVKIKKPGMRDKPHPTKYEFIMAKYKLLLLLPKLSHKDNPNYMEDLCKQLHASVRTSNLETCLRLLSLGANPNYVHPDRGNTPLHVAAQAGQAMQVELLCVYGANPCLLDRLGHTPEECARIAGHHQLADRLIESQYELTDKLSFFLCGRKPVHSIGEHYLVPQVSGSGLNLGLTEARSRLQELSNDLFEQLAADVYDEVDRRETDALWLTTQQLQSSVAFLPVNPSLSPLRNQGRQKLATLDAQEFAQLVVDILVDTKRRQTISLETGQKSGTVVPSTSDEQAPSPGCYDPHDYDEVPMEEMSRSPPPSSTGGYATIKDPDGVHAQVKGDYAEVGGPHPGPAPSPGHTSGSANESISTSEFSVVQSQLKEVQTKKTELEETNESLQKQLIDMQKQLNKVIEENSQLRTASQSSPTSPPIATTPTSPPPPPPDHINEPLPDYARVDKSKKTRRPSGGSRPSSRPLSNPHSNPSPRHSGHTPTDLTVPKKSSVSSDVVTPPPGRMDTPPGRQDTPLSDSAFDEPSSEVAGKKAGPSLEEIHLHIKKLTHCIQELLQAAQGQRQSSFPPCSLKIMRGVEALIGIFPTAATSHEVQVSLREVIQASKRLQGECRVSGHSDLAFRTRHIINSAYDVAKAARHLVLCVEQEKAVDS